jgi:hypothetical protein
MGRLGSDARHATQHLKKILRVPREADRSERSAFGGPGPAANAVMRHLDRRRRVP